MNTSCLSATRTYMWPLSLDMRRSCRALRAAQIPQRIGSARGLRVRQRHFVQHFQLVYVASEHRHIRAGCLEQNRRCFSSPGGLGGVRPKMKRTLTGKVEHFLPLGYANLSAAPPRWPRALRLPPFSVAQHSPSVANCTGRYHCKTKRRKKDFLSCPAGEEVS